MNVSCAPGGVITAPTPITRGDNFTHDEALIKEVQILRPTVATPQALGAPLGTTSLLSIRLVTHYNRKWQLVITFACASPTRLPTVL
jgi:hypothetical protein